MVIAIEKPSLGSFIVFPEIRHDTLVSGELTSSRMTNWLFTVAITPFLCHGSINHSRSYCRRTWSGYPRRSEGSRISWW
jgi:hypothetical protein